jgi:hypothetical protein
VNKKTILLWFLMSYGIAGWSSLFAFTGFEAENQHIGGILQPWIRVEQQDSTGQNGKASYLTSFELNHVRMWVDGEIVPGYFGYWVEAEFVEEPSLVDAYVRMWATRNLEVKIGRFYPTFTLYGPALVNALESPYYPLIDERLGPGRQIGIEFDRRSRFVQLYVGAFNGSDRPNAWSDTTSSKDIMVRTDVTLLDWMRLVMEGMYGKEALTDSLEGEHLLTGLAFRMDWELTVHVRAEWLRRWRDVPAVAHANPTREQISEGVLLHLGYSFTTNLEALIRYEWYDGDLDRDASWGIDDAWIERVTLGIQYQIVPDHLSLNGYYLHHSQESTPALRDDSIRSGLDDQAILECQFTF